MKKTMVLGLAAGFLATACFSGSAMADHHKGGDDSKGHRGAKMFEKMDANGDELISLEEFNAHHAEKFKKMDVDGDGKVTKEEAKAAHEKMREKMKEKREEWRKENGGKYGGMNKKDDE